MPHRKPRPGASERFPFVDRDGRADRRAMIVFLKHGPPSDFPPAIIFSAIASPQGCGVGQPELDQGFREAFVERLGVDLAKSLMLLWTIALAPVLLRGETFGPFNLSNFCRELLDFLVGLI